MDEGTSELVSDRQVWAWMSVSKICGAELGWDRDNLKRKKGGEGWVGWILGQGPGVCRFCFLSSMFIMKVLSFFYFCLNVA